MIFRKPYAFLIKHFRFIHFILALASLFVLFKYQGMLGYYDDVILNSSGYLNALEYMDSSVYYVLFFIMFLVAIVIWLFRYKKKPRVLYYVFFLGSFVLIVLTSLLYSNLEVVATEAIDSRTLLIYRDLVRISLLYQYFILIFMIVRCLGFDIKKFNFRSDLLELNIGEKDNEEIEVSLGIDSDRIRQIRRRKLRDLRYYYLENKLFVWICILVVGIFFIGGVFVEKKVINVTYSENKMVTSSVYEMQVNHSYITKYSDNNVMIMQDGSGFVLVKLDIKTINEYKYQLDISSFVLQISGDIYLPTKKYYSYFSSLGSGYSRQYVTPTVRSYIFAYVVESSRLDDKMQFMYQGNLEGGENIVFDLSPINLDEEEVIGTYDLGNVINIGNYSSYDVDFSINSYEYAKEYSYTYCYLEKCDYSAVVYSPNHLILRLDISDGVSNEFINSLINNYIDIKYIVDGVTYSSNIYRNKMPIDISDYIYIEVDEEIVNASKIWIEFKARNKLYNYVLKES